MEINTQDEFKCNKHKRRYDELKIAMIGHKRIPSREGGVEIVVNELSSRMVELGHDIIAYNRKCDSVYTMKNYKGIKIIWVPTINRKNLDAFIYSFLATVHALFGKYDVIHYHALGPSVMLVIPHLLGIKTVATIHGLDWQRAKWGGFGSWYLKLGEKIIAKYADEIIVLSKNVQKYIKKTYNRDTNYICNGVNRPIKKEVKNIKIKYNLDKNGYILFLARIVPEKGLHYLIEAFKKIDTGKKLVIAGGSSNTNDYFEKIVDMVKDDKRIIMTGFVQGEELEELYTNTILYVLPSDIEGMPISLLEAMSYDCPCLVSDIEENKEIVKVYGMTFKRGDIEDLKIKLTKCIEHGVHRPTINMADEFNWDNTVNETLSIYLNKEHVDYAKYYSE